MSCLSARPLRSSSFFLLTTLLSWWPPPEANASLIVCPATWERWEILIRWALPLDVFLFALCICLKGESVPEFLAWLLLQFRIDMGESFLSRANEDLYDLASLGIVLELMLGVRGRTDSNWCAAYFHYRWLGWVAVYKCLCNSFRILNELVSFSFSSRAETSEEIQLEAIMQVHFMRHTRCQLSGFKYFLISPQSGKVFHRWYVIFRWPNGYEYILMFALFSQRQLDCLEILFVFPWLQKVRNTAKYNLLNDPTTRKWLRTLMIVNLVSSSL